MLTPDFKTFDCRGADLQRRERLEERVQELMGCKTLSPAEHAEYHRAAVELLVRWRDMVIVPADADEDGLVLALRGLGFQAAAGISYDEAYDRPSNITCVFFRVVVVFERPWPSGGSTGSP